MQEWTPPPPAPRSRRDRRLALAGVLLVLALAGFGAAYRIAAVGSREAAAVRPTPPTVAPPVVAVLSLSQAAAQSLSRVVTIESVARDREELGTGWLIDDRGDFVTNWHVVEGNLGIRIRDRADGTHVGMVMGSDREHDIAVIRSVDGFAGVPLPVETQALRIPQEVVVLASSRATQHTDQTEGTLARLHQDVPVRGTDVDPGFGDLPTVYTDMMALRARIYAGNSGGPVLDDRGRVVGIVTLASRASAQAFAIPLDRVLGEIRAFAGRPGG
ncbi:MAG: trypsin-like peptidase domain-containing protein [Chloroflexi bacterium]|nr:MAG: trypsin-like peptidase domain-containing protein [Chloroflexota bacterium]